ncbi:MAG: ParB N-terminal domain-containing protein [bacterium]|nr:ParB N-terminal domain-containing protein [bacterium]
MVFLPITAIKYTSHVRKELGDIETLAEDIQQHGMVHPLVVNQNNELLAGYRRLKAAERLGWHEVPVTIIHSDQTLTQLDIQLAENMKRKELTPLEISEVILERKHRFEQRYGPIHRGGNRMGQPNDRSKLQTPEFAPPNFYTETAKLLNLSASSIFALLQLRNLDPDLKEQVSNRKLGYCAALEEQAKRNRTRKLLDKTSTPLKSIPLPNKADIAPLQKQYQSAPNLMNLFMLVQHSYQTVHQMKERTLEFDRFEPEYLFLFIQRLEEVVDYYQKLLATLLQMQEQNLREQYT